MKDNLRRSSWKSPNQMVKKVSSCCVALAEVQEVVSEDGRCQPSAFGGQLKSSCLKYQFAYRVEFT
ncbi:unnamed protein product [Arabis nemorensis]|uniref:Uncharacterized protein n=1 Tax=Arabis nemorensis TaxID=586526 RepID=A0A565C5F3_9BRAS|nr:unnamed protein product [Arabis nemorensis]